MQDEGVACRGSSQNAVATGDRKRNSESSHTTSRSQAATEEPEHAAGCQSAQQECLNTKKPASNAHPPRTANGSAVNAGCSSTPRTAALSSTARRRRAFGRAKLGTCALLLPFRVGPGKDPSSSTSGSASPRLLSARPHRLAATAGDGAAVTAARRAPSTAQARVAAVRARAAARRREPRARTGEGVGTAAAATAPVSAAEESPDAAAAAALGGSEGGGRRLLAMAPALRAGEVVDGARRALDLTIAVGRHGERKRAKETERGHTGAEGSTKQTRRRTLDVGRREPTSFTLPHEEDQCRNCSAPGTSPSKHRRRQGH